ncbi:acyl-CoA dehydratase activase [Geopsychrobacter electrodiphilus]|uniref:acyl-CoA dehydratase activase n=1 Tax=Geopsychrobacter electrodiphilus TaxID=225196 RepID=UPI0003652F83|nr:acyl-CoA dehydratase activase [Geopsychrobacter electrodiphilus]
MFLGIDLGSRTIKLAAVKDGQLLTSKVAESGFEPHNQALTMLKDHQASSLLDTAGIVATGYGRHLAEKHFADAVITEIKAHALGARHLFPDCRTILDVGGQDSKVISLTPDGRVASFQMNDKCAAGTGRFMEMMAGTLGFSLSEFGLAAAESDQVVPINSMCAVFAESEVVSLKNRGLPASDIARSIHLAVVERVAGMLERLGICGELIFSGGVANNAFLVAQLEKRIGVPVRVPECPDIIGALGAALHAETSHAK